jgi:hypothetical protein
MCVTTGWAAWLYDLLKPHVAKLVVCNPRKNALLKPGNKRNKIDARKLVDRLRLDDLKPFYHGETGLYWGCFTNYEWFCKNCSARLTASALIFRPPGTRRMPRQTRLSPGPKRQVNAEHKSRRLPLRSNQLFLVPGRLMWPSYESK